MKTTANIFMSAVIASFVAGAATAQESAFDNRGAAGDSFEDLTDAIDDDAERDIDPFGNLGRQVGWDGSFALRATASTGNTDSTDLGLGASVGYYDGRNGYDLTLTYSYGEDAGVKTEDSLLYGLEYTRDINDRFYAYGQVQGSHDPFASYVEDTFAGVGVGYRVIDRADAEWNIAFGPGYRWAEQSDGTKIEEEALSLSSNYASRLSSNMMLTMDTDIIGSESDVVLYNDLGVNVAMTNALALRTSIATEYHTDPLPGDKDTDNTFGVSLVYSFN